MTNVVAFAEAKQRLRPVTEREVSQPHALPSPDGVENIPRFDLGYPGCSGHEVPEPELDYHEPTRKLRVRFDGSQQITEISLAPDDADLVLKDCHKYSFCWMIAGYLVMNGVHYRQVPVWLPVWIDAAVDDFKKINNIGPSFRDSLYSSPQVVGGGILEKTDDYYRHRTNRAEKAPEFLKRVYAAELAAGSLTLSDLRQRDRSLWAGLRNWASAGDHDLDAVIPRGRTTPGPVPDRDLNFDPSTLDPNDPKDALALSALRNRSQTRVRMQKLRSQQKLG